MNRTLIIKIQLVHTSCLIQCSGACSRHLGAQFVRGTVENLVVGGNMLISVLNKFSVRMCAEFVWLWRGKAGSLLWLWVWTLGSDKFENTSISWWVQISRRCSMFTLARMLLCIDLLGWHTVFWQFSFLYFCMILSFSVKNLRKYIHAHIYLSPGWYRRPVHWADTLIAFMCRLSRSLGASTPWKPLWLY
jgi:hypothetical protein